MAHEILSAKLCEMDTKYGKIHGRIRCCEHLSDDRLEEEIEALRIEIDEEKKIIFHSLLSCKADISMELRNELDALKDNYESTFTKLYQELEACLDPGKRAEVKSLFAEYGIDFAMLAASHSILMALEAINAERNIKEEANSL